MSRYFPDCSARNSRRERAWSNNGLLTLTVCYHNRVIIRDVNFRLSTTTYTSWVNLNGTTFLLRFIASYIFNAS